MAPDQVIEPATSRDDLVRLAPLALHDAGLPALAARLGAHTALTERDAIADHLLWLLDRIKARDASAYSESNDYLVRNLLGNPI